LVEFRERGNRLVEKPTQNNDIKNTPECVHVLNGIWTRDPRTWEL